MQLSEDPVEREKQLAAMMERSRRCLAELKAPIELRPEYRAAKFGHQGGLKGWDNYVPPASRFVLSKFAGRIGTHLREN